MSWAVSRDSQRCCRLVEDVISSVRTSTNGKLYVGFKRRRLGLAISVHSRKGRTRVAVPPPSTDCWTMAESDERSNKPGKVNVSISGAQTPRRRFIYVPQESLRPARISCYADLTRAYWSTGSQEKSVVQWTASCHLLLERPGHAGGYRANNRGWSECHKARY
jgi:hypothetical protein